MKVVLLGTGEVAAPAVERLVASRHTLLTCVTQPDRVQGRGLRPHPSPVKRAALAHHIPVLEPETLDASFAQALQELAPDIAVVVDFGHKIPPALLTLPRLGMIGIHPSLLPKYRGAAPIQWALIHGEEMTGVTIFRLAETWDSGDILLQDMTAIHADETAVELQTRLAALGAELVVRGLDLLAAGPVQWHAQDVSAATPAPKLSKADGRLRWDHPATELINRIRGLQPWPGAYTGWQGKQLKIFGARRLPGAPGAAPGTVTHVTDEGLIVAARDGDLLVTQLQPEGGRLMSAADFCRGHEISVGDRLQ